MTLQLLAENELLTKYLKAALQEYEGCLYCKSMCFVNGYPDCNNDSECDKYSLYEIDYDKFRKDFGFGE